MRRSLQGCRCRAAARARERWPRSADRTRAAAGLASGGGNRGVDPPVRAGDRGVDRQRLERRLDPLEPILPARTFGGSTVACGPAANSASVTAEIAISEGRSPGSTRPRSITTDVSTNPGGELSQPRGRVCWSSNRVDVSS